MVIVLLEYIDLFLRLAVLQVRIFSILKIIIPIMLALCLMLSGTYYAKNYAGIIGRGLSFCTTICDRGQTRSRLKMALDL